MNCNIKTSQGTYTYTFVPLFAGALTINKEVAARNLSLFKQILDGQGIPFLLAYGTLLGAVREHDFISHDEDIDLNMHIRYRQQLFDSLFLLRDAGFEVCRYDRRGVISFMRDGEYIDIYIFNPESDEVLRCGREIMPSRFLTDTTVLQFKNEQYLVPLDYEQYLSFFYGDNWRTPIKYYNYAQPAWKHCISEFLQYFKEFLPDFLFFPLVEIQDKKYREPFVQKMRKMGIKFTKR